MLEWFVSSALASPDAASIHAVITGARSTGGAVICQLFDAPAAFPESGARDVRSSAVTRRATGEHVASCTFEGLVPGTYAVSVVHDEDGDGRMNRSWLGMPQEGYGVSNDRTHALSAPTWNESRFALASGGVTEIVVPLHY